jgi:hypothetical protein
MVVMTNHLPMRNVCLWAAISLSALPATAQSNWAYDPAPAMAQAFCAARANGKSGDEALDAFNKAGSYAWTGGALRMLGHQAEIRAAADRAVYLIKQECPEALINLNLISK